MSSAPPRSPHELRLIAEIRDARFAPGLVCVRCRSPRVCRWGHFAGRQRYRCATCRRTFSDLTGTPAAYLKRLPLLPSYRECMAASLSVRASARSAGVHPSTSFRWRHRLLSVTLAMPTAALSGLVELEEGFVRCTDGGERTGLPRGQRRSRMNPDWERSWLMIVRDRTGRAAIGSAGYRRPNTEMWASMVRTYVDDGSVVVTRAPRLGQQLCAARRNGLASLDCRSRGPGRASELLWHVRHAGAVRGAFRRWLRRFRGVKSKYLDNYIAWQGLLDRDMRTSWRIEQLLYWPCAPPQ